MEEQINKNDLIYEPSKYVYDSRRLRTRSVLDVNLKFNNKVKPKPKARKKKESNTYETADSLYEGQ